MPPQQRNIKKILIANRGEIAVRLFQACHELPEPPTTYGIYTSSDNTHVALGRPSHAVQIPSPASYMDIDFLLGLIKKHGIDAVHPGYGFLSENSEFSKRAWDEADCMVIGPGWEVLASTGDKLKAKEWASKNGVPILWARIWDAEKAKAETDSDNDIPYPVMVKAVDGGGGRGIRLVRKKDELQNAIDRCASESPSRTVFLEQAAVDGFKHVEVQILGDGKGEARHFWERDCSVQRRFQKIVEVAPTPVEDRGVVIDVINSAVQMAKSIKYLGLGTFEFLANINKKEFFFLEINPRLQVEHTISESICGIDLVRRQLLMAQGEEDLSSEQQHKKEAAYPPDKFSIQLRLCAEDPDSNFALSIGKVTNAQFPTGNGVRVDSHLSKGGIVGSDFDNLMAKIIVTAPSWKEVIARAKRTLADTVVIGVKTNLAILRAVIYDRGFQSGQADTQWLEQNLDRLVKEGNQISKVTDQKTSSLPQISNGSSASSSAAAAASSNATTTFRKGDAWSLTLGPASTSPSAKSQSSSSSSTSNNAAAAAPHHISITKISRNEFPTALTAEIQYTLPSQQPRSFSIALQSTSASSASATSSSHRRGDPANKNHIVVPMSGKLVEVLVEEGDQIEENQVIAFVKQMKMELEVRSPRKGRAKWVIEMAGDAENGGGGGGDGGGDDVGEGVLLVELEGGNASKL